MVNKIYLAGQDRLLRRVQQRVNNFKREQTIFFKHFDMIFSFDSIRPKILFFEL